MEAQRGAAEEAKRVTQSKTPPPPQTPKVPTKEVELQTGPSLMQGDTEEEAEKKAAPAKLQKKPPTTLPPTATDSTTEDDETGATTVSLPPKIGPPSDLPPTRPPPQLPPKSSPPMSATLASRFALNFVSTSISLPFSNVRMYVQFSAAVAPGQGVDLQAAPEAHPDAAKVRPQALARHAKAALDRVKEIYPPEKGKADGNQSFPPSSARSPPPKAKATKAPTSHPEEVPAGSDEAAAASALAEAERERYFERLRRQQPIAPEILDEDECRDALEANLVASEQFSIRQVMEYETFKKHFSIFFQLITLNEQFQRFV